MSFAKLGSQDRSAVTQLLNGDIVVAWTDANGAAINVRGQILNSDGVTKDGSEFMLNTTLSGDQFDVALTALGNGGFAAGWTSSADWPSNRTPPFPELWEDGGYQNHAISESPPENFSRLFSPASVFSITQTGGKPMIFRSITCTFSVNRTSKSSELDARFAVRAPMS